MHVASLGFRTDLMVRRLAGSVITEHDNHIVVTTPTNPGFWWGNFLVLPGPLTGGDAERVRTLFTAELPPTARMAIGLEGCDDVGATSDVEALGLEVIRDVVLTTSAVITPVAPSRGQIRELRTNADWNAMAALRDAWQGPPSGEGDRQFRELRLAEERGLVERGAAGWVGAYDGEELVSALGIVSDGSGIARYQDVETHPDHRRRGHARHLLHAAAAYAGRKLGAGTFVIVADPAYHAIDLYRSAGFSDAEWQIKLEPPT